jgi:hypothetical protein
MYLLNSTRGKALKNINVKNYNLSIGVPCSIALMLLDLRLIYVVYINTQCNRVSTILRWEPQGDSDKDISTSTLIILKFQSLNFTRIIFKSTVPKSKGKVTHVLN